VMKSEKKNFGSFTIQIEAVIYYSYYVTSFDLLDILFFV
jgi:hypothetical protein